MSSAAGCVIDAQNLTKHFRSRTAVDGLTLQVAPGEIYGLVGPDGAGKTTSLRMLAGIMRPTRGTARIAGHSIDSAHDRIKDSIAYMSQRFGLYVDLSVQENIDFYADLYGVPRGSRGERIDRLLDFSSMRPFKNRLAGNLSGGMKQKLQLVCALIHTPKVLLLDEPTNGVDPVSRRDFWRILYRLVRQGVAILVTTAYLDEAERCSRVGLLDGGKLLAQGSPEEVKQMISGTILEVRSPRARQAARILKGALPETRVNLFGDTIHITCKDAAACTRRITRLFDQSRIAVEDIGVQPATIEDVFVSMVTDSAPAQKSGTPSASSDEDAWEKRIKILQDRPAVQVENLTRRFGNFVAVDRLSFTIPQGQIFGFLGPNGAGKSTCIRMLCGLLAPSEGGGRVAGIDIAAGAEQIKQNIGYMSQKFSLYDDLTVEENIDFYGGIYGLRSGRLAKRKDWAIEMAGLDEQRRTMTAILSGGWKQRLAMACAVLHEPPIVFLDEPTSGADPLSRRRFWELIYSMAGRGVTVFVTTHYMEEAEYCDRLALIYQGKIIAMGTARELKTRMMHETVLNITCPRPQDIMEQVAAVEGVRDVALFGAGMHAVAEAAETASAIRQLFLSRGHACTAIEPIVPSMEDVFVSLVEAFDRNNAAGAVP